MNPTEPGDRKLTTADLAAAARQPTSAKELEERVARAEPREAKVTGTPASAASMATSESAGMRASPERSSPAAERTRTEMPVRAGTPSQAEELDPLFPPETARDYRTRWAAVQSSFVDDPRKAARQGDELVAQVMKSLAESFAAERDKLEGQLGQSGEASTEVLRVSLRRYRSFFERLLSL